MFVQVIEGKVSDSAALKQRLDNWQKELRPGAKGYLGATGGVTESGETFAAVRFESEADAKANSDRPEQGEWWAETEKLFDGTPTFSESNDVQVAKAPPNDAGFVQVIKSKVSNRKRLEEINEQVVPVMEKSRPDVVGMVTIWFGDRSYDIAYFSSEAAAREGEKAEMPSEHADLFEEWQSLISDVSYVDLKDPWLF